MSALQVHQLPVLEDNYIYILRHESARLTAVVDPPLAPPVLDFIASKNWSLDYILNTHHHPDHVGGNLELKAQTRCQVVAAAVDHRRIPGHDLLLKDGEVFDFGGHPARVKELPGHTLGHIAYHFEREALLFSGDVLFAMGCGRLFEGSARQMQSSLAWIRHLPAHTLVHCAHEYTLANAQFAATIEPTNAELKKRTQWARQQRLQNLPTVPFRLGEDRLSNPFLRWDQPEVRQTLKMEECEDHEVFAQLRALKDHF